ncbi:tRNA:m(4)X modification enzyme TRM13 homolog isoform X2 [Varroa jacobsoni]|nr:tRNA:m(4)X modification enzyme TRM13 homolog isoform X2 [Varroa jacobsoni]
MPCPLDPSHSCYEHLLNAHIKKCNAREKPLPPYLVKNINGEDVPSPEEKISVHTVSDEELQALIQRIESIYESSVSHVMQYESTCHLLIVEELTKFKDCTTLEKHLRQQGHLIQLLCDKGLITEGHIFVEFGAGRGQLATWVMRALGDKAVRKSAFVLVDRDSQRYKADNRFIDEWGPFIHRIRADIRHLCIERLEPFKVHKDRVVGFCKHLCGVAIDLALRCITSTIGYNKLPKGLVMAVCCHHRCEWRWYTGKSWLEGLGISEREFQLLASIAGWATCGNESRSTKNRCGRKTEDLSGKNGTAKAQVKAKKTLFPDKNGERSLIASIIEPTKSEASETANCGLMRPKELDKKGHISSDVDQEKSGRYQAMGLSSDRRTEIGYKVKAILDEGRLKYLRSVGMIADRVNFISKIYTPENFAIVATGPTAPQ